MSLYEIKREYHKIRGKDIIPLYEQALAEGSELGWLLDTAADFADMEVIEYLMEKGVNPLEANSSGWTILWCNNYASSSFYK